MSQNANFPIRPTKPSPCESSSADLIKPPIRSGPGPSSYFSIPGLVQRSSPSSDALLSVLKAEDQTLPSLCLCTDAGFQGLYLEISTAHRLSFNPASIMLISAKSAGLYALRAEHTSATSRKVHRLRASTSQPHRIHAACL